MANGGISADGLTYTFKLRPDTKWTDGTDRRRRTTSSTRIKRIFDPAVGVYYASFFLDIVGAEDTYNATDATPDQVADSTAGIGVTAIDDTTLEIKLASTGRDIHAADGDAFGLPGAGRYRQGESG